MVGLEPTATRQGFHLAELFQLRLTMAYTRSSRVCGGFVQAFRLAWPSFRAVSMFHCNMSTVDRWPSFAWISSQIPKVITARCEGFIPHPLVRWAWSRRADSNRHPRVTNPVLCPLSYKGIYKSGRGFAPRMSAFCGFNLFAFYHRAIRSRTYLYASTYSATAHCATIWI